MSKHKETSAIVDNILRYVVGSGALAVGILAPNAWILLDKPLQNYFKNLDKRQREREWTRIVGYMKKKQLLAEDYEFGLTITKKGRKRAEKVEFEQLAIPLPNTWDKQWRIVIYDIPEKHKLGRDHLTDKLKQLGFYQLQRSVWVYPFPCRKEIEAITLHYGVEKYVTYIKTRFVDKNTLLRQKFTSLQKLL